MRFKARSRESDIPEINLVPMLDVLMTVLTFFIIVSMTLTGKQIANVRLPQSVLGIETPTQEEGQKTEPMVVGLDKDSNLVLEDQKVSFAEVGQSIRTYFAENPDGKIILKADRELSYADVANLLVELRSIGGNRVSLAVE
ncbi:MAG TPA: biopolymer transporter ExbD [Leptolyngbyaceae cyanobacterium]